jgi:actin-related protein
MYGGDEVSALVVDVGCDTVKAGYAGEDAPKHVFSTALGCMASDDGSAVKKWTVDSLHAPLPGLDVSSAFTDGLVTNWDGLEEVSAHQQPCSVAPPPAPGDT